MDYRILGPLEVEVDGIEVDLGPRKQKSLFALLLIHHGHTVSTDRILEALWGLDAAGKENALWVYISRLRSALGEVASEPVLLTRDRGYELHLEQGQLDADRFEVLVRDGMAVRESDPAYAADTLRAALDLWRGQALEEFAYDDFARDEIRRLEALRTTCLDARIDADLACGGGGELLGELEQLVESRPLDEQPVRHLMMALYRSGRQAEALRVFKRFRRSLGEETGTDPSPELYRLEEQILFHDARLARTVDGDRTPSDGGPNPYKGLEAFGEDDAHLFFGRDALTAEILRRVDTHAIVTVVGPSGCGKSSVVRSAVIPAIRKGALPSSDRWHVATMIPGRHPFIELEAALLRSTLDAPASLREHLDGSPDELLRAGLRVLPSDDASLVLVIDQFEELFTLADEATTQRFLDAVVEASLDDRRRIRFVITLRADFYDRPLAHAGFGSAMDPGIVNVVPMAPEELEQAASGPAMRAGVRLEPGLEAALIGDVLREPGALPLFEFALTDLYDRRIGDTLTLEAYRTMGGIDGAISRKAEHLYAGLSPDQQRATQQVFLRLVSLSDGDTRSRRRVDASELLSIDLDVTDLQAVLDTFGSQRLILFDRDDATGSPTVEVSHEALLDHWARLAGWIASATVDLTTNTRLAALATEWQDHGEDPAYLLSEGRLTAYSTWAEDSTMALAGPERRFLEASRLADEDRKLAEEVRIEREVATARRARRNASSLVAVLVIVAGVASLLVWNAVRPAGPSVVLVHDGADRGSIQSMVLSGFQRAAADFDIEARDEVVLSGMRERIVELAEKGTDVIIGGLDFSDFIWSIHEDYPDTRFVIVDTQAEGYANVSAATFDDFAGSHTVGAVAALTTETRTVGIVVGLQVAFMQAFVDGYDSGVAAIDPGIEVLVDFSSSEWVEAPGGEPDWPWVPAGWFDVEATYDAAWAMYEAGADVVFVAAGTASDGAIRAAAEFSESAGRHVWAIGVDTDASFTTDPKWSPYVLTSMAKSWDEVIYQSIEAYLDEDLDETLWFGFHNDGLRIPTNGDAMARIRPEVEAIIAGLANRTREPPRRVPVTPVSWREPADVDVLATLSDEALDLGSAPLLDRSDMVDYRFVNQSDRAATCGTFFLPEGVSAEDVEALSENLDDPSGAVLALGGLPTFSWGVAPSDGYDIRTWVPPRPMMYGGVLCGRLADGPDGTPEVEVFVSPLLEVSNEPGQS